MVSRGVRDPLEDDRLRSYIGLYHSRVYDGVKYDH